METFDNSRTSNIDFFLNLVGHSLYEQFSDYLCINDNDDFDGSLIMNIPSNKFYDLLQLMDSADLDVKWVRLSAFYLSIDFAYLGCEGSPVRILVSDKPDLLFDVLNELTLCYGSFEIY